MASINLQQAWDRALQDHQAGRIQAAETLCRQILLQQPNHHDAMHLLGIIAYQVDRNDIAVNLLRNALALNPRWPEAHVNLGNALLGLKQVDDAIAAYRQAISLRPGYADAYGNLGAALKAKGQLDEAIDSCRKAIGFRSANPEAHNNLGVVLREKGLLDEAIAAYRKAIAIKPDHADTRKNLGDALLVKGVILAKKGLGTDGIDAFREAIELGNDSADAHYNLGNALRDAEDFDGAIAEFKEANARDANPWRSCANLGIVLQNMGRIDDALAAFRQAVSLAPSEKMPHGNLVSLLNYHPAFDAHAIAREQRRWNEKFAEPLAQFIQPHANNRDSDRRLRIGYVSPDFRDHVVAWNMLPLLSQHDRGQFEITCYASVRRSDAMTARLQKLSDHWRNISDLTDEAAADQIREDRIDILIDLAVHSADNRLLIFARKPAPVQVTYLGYCGSTGLKAIDYRLSDPYCDPEGTDLTVYSERTFRLPKTFWCYQPGPAPDPAPPPALNHGFVTFGCLNNFGKISFAAINLWTRILLDAPDSHLMIHAMPGTHRNEFVQRIGQAGISEERISFVGRIGRTEYMKTYSQIDIALDPFPYGGGITTCDALWMGVPVVSLSGNTAVGRGGRSILSNIGLPELIACSPDEYVRIAIDLANNMDRLTNLRHGLRSRMLASPLMDAPQFTRDIEAAYRQMWHHWCKSP